MRHVALTTVAVFTAAVAIVACEQQVADRNPTAPEVDVSFAKQLGGQCDAARLRLINTQLADYFTPKAIEDSAKALVALVESSCSTDTGKSRMLDYIQFTIDHRLNRESGQTDALLLTHWNTVFPYVGYTGNDQPSNVPVTVFSDGRAKVIDGGVTDSLNATNAALTFFKQDAGGDERDHLFVIYPIASNCLTGDLQQYGPCFHFAAFPHASATWKPKAKLGICEVHDSTDAISNHITSPALAHLDPITKVTDQVSSHYPEYCFDDAGAIPQGSWHDGFGAAVTRLAWMAKRAVTPQSAYAGHGGLGGLGGGFSPVGAVDREVFRATFTADTVGKQPGQPETGTWGAIQTKNPGTILVQSSLGNISTNVAVLNQSGGNCKNCFGLLLQGNLEHAGTALATAGSYDVEWTSLQDNANMKEAVFVLRSSTGAEIARVTYAVRSNVKRIIYNDKASSATDLGLWVQHVSDSFRIRVNLDDKTTTMWFNGVEMATDVPFNSSAANFATVSADFRGIDSGVMGWDNIIVTRLSDEN